MKAEDLELIKNVPVFTWLPITTLAPDLLEKLELEYLIERRRSKLVPTWSPKDKGFTDVKVLVNEFQIKHRILEIHEKFYVCTQSPIAITVYAFYCGRCVKAGDRDAVLAEVQVKNLSRIQEYIEEVKYKLSEISTIKKTKKIKLY